LYRLATIRIAAKGKIEAAELARRVEELIQ
jgi:hypothetical protein